MLQATLEASRRALGNTQPETLATAQSLENVRSAILRAEEPTTKGSKAAARRIERAAAPALRLSPTALAEVEARARAAEAELLAMLDLEEPASEAGAGADRARRRAR
jgi:hypothetical protein